MSLIRIGSRFLLYSAFGMSSVALFNIHLSLLDEDEQRHIGFVNKQTESSQAGEENNITDLSAGSLSEYLHASYHIHSLTLKTVEAVLKSDELMDQFNIPKELRPLIRDSWEENQADLISRINFVQEEGQALKFIGYSEEDSEKAVLTQIILSFFAKSVEVNQYNYLENAMKYIRDDAKENYGPNLSVLFEINGANEDISALNEFLNKDGVQIDFLRHENIIYDTKSDRLRYKKDNSPEKDIDWLYIFETSKILSNQNLLEYIKDNKKKNRTVISEPLWKVILYSQALLPYLHSVYPDDPYITPAYFINKENKENILEFASNTPMKLVSESIDREDLQTTDFKMESIQKFEKFYENEMTLAASKSSQRILKPKYDEESHPKRKILSTYMAYGVPVSISFNTKKEGGSFHAFSCHPSDINLQFSDNLRSSYLIRQRLYGGNDKLVKESLKRWIAEPGFTSKAIL